MGRGVGLCQATQNRSPDLDLPRGDLHVPVLGGPDHHGSNDGHHILGPEPMGEVERGRIGPIRPKGHLKQPASVAKIEEDQPAQISAAVNPARQLELGPLVIRANAAQHPRA